MKSSPFQPAERRRYFRIDDEVALRFRVIDAAELESELARFQVGFPDKLSVASAFASTSVHMQRTVEQFRRDMPELAEYLQGLNEKIDLLVQLLAASDNDLADAPTHDVTLSASGLSFRTPQPVPVGSILELKLLVFPSYVCMLCFGDVVRSERVDDGDGDPVYDLGVDFTHIRETDRELLFRHVTRRQSELLREAKIALDPRES